MEYHKNLRLEDLFYINDDGLVCCEEWYDIPGYESFYQLSNLARVKSLQRYAYHPLSKAKQRIVKERILKNHSYHKTGHLSIVLQKNGMRPIRTGIHVIVARVHIPNPFNLPIVEHLNDIPTDNRPSNLMWSTIKENTRHAVERGLLKPFKGESNGRSKLTEKQVLEIRSSNLPRKELTEIYNISKTVVAEVILRRTWKHV